MNSLYVNTTRPRAADVRAFAALLGTASFLAIASGGAAQAQATAPAAAATTPAAAATAPGVEEVLVTGSLIRGQAAVGVPVTALSTQDFRETGEVTVTGFLQSLPSLKIDTSPSPTFGGGNIIGQNVRIHGIVTSSVETLLLVDGLRWPPQNTRINPSIIPQIAVDHIDVLTAGASAVYGSDASIGVINVLLKRGFDGAISQVSASAAPGVSYHTEQFSQLYGKSWDSGNVTVSFETTQNSGLSGTERDYYTLNLEPYGLMDATPLTTSVPAVITTGSAQTVPGTIGGQTFGTGTRFCANCYSVPKGQNGQNLAWSSILDNKGVLNERNPWLNGAARPKIQTNAATLAFDQNLTNDFFGLGPVSLSATAFYSNQRGKQIYPPGNGEGRNELIGNFVVPSSNPYYPIGAPAGIRANYNLGIEMPLIITGGEVAGRYSGSFNFDKLPFDWHGKLTYSMSEDQNYLNQTNAVNQGNLNAALGNTVVDTTGQLSPYTKPATIPYFNIFCDPTAFKTCNDPRTLAYIAGYNNRSERFKIQETDANFDGPLFTLPGGQVKAAIGYQHLSENDHYVEPQNDSTPSTSIIAVTEQFAARTSNAVFGQIDVPLIGEGNALPLIQALDIEGGYRYDSYSDVQDPVYTPKLAANWTVGAGLTIRGAWGKSFRVPTFTEGSAVMSGIIETNSIRSVFLGGLAGSSVILGCGSVNGSPANVAVAGSLTAALNPTCSTDPALRKPVGITVNGPGNGAAAVLRNGQGLGPETVRQWSAGFSYAPTDPLFGVNLKGLSLNATYFSLKFNGLITSVSQNQVGGGPDDPASFFQYTVIPDPTKPITDPANASFYELAQKLLALPNHDAGPANTFDPADLAQVKFIDDIATINLGTRKLSGIDFDGRYDWDMGDTGIVTIGATGYYQMSDKSQASATTPVIDAYEGKNSGNRLQRVRYRLGWTDANNVWSVTAFADYLGHSGINPYGNSLIPSCYYTGATACYPGAQQYGPYNVFPNYAPANVLLDLTVGYQTQDMPTNPYLRNIGVQLTVNNVLDKRPPFQLGVNSGNNRGQLHAIDIDYSDLQRVVNLTITKAW